MPLNRNIEIGLSIDTRTFIRDVTDAVDSIQALQSSVTTAQGALGKFSFPTPAPGLKMPEPGSAAGSRHRPPERRRGAQATGAAAEIDTVPPSRGRRRLPPAQAPRSRAIGPQIAGSMQQAIMPLQRIGGLIGSQMNIVGGAIERLSMRIDSTLKMQSLKSTLQDVQTRIRSGVATAAAAASTSLTLMQRATLRLGPAADKAISAYLGFSKVRGLVTGTNEAFSKGLGQLNRINFATPIAGATKLGGQFRTMAPAVNRVSNSVKGLGLQIGLALGVVGLAYKATTALVGFFKSGIEGANNLNETMNKVKETFGSSSGVVTGLADQLASRYGLVKGPILDAAASFGLIGKGAGLSTEAAAKMSAELTQLAADATSLFHVPMAESLAKIQSGLVGESKPLRDFGVQLSEEAVKAEALSLGLKRGKGDLDNMQKIMARASLITKGLATATGDLDRTQHDAANQFLKAGGGIQNFATSIGTMLIPTVKVAASAFNELLASVVTVFETNKDLVQGWADSVKSGMDLVAMVIRNMGEYWTIFKLQTLENLSNVLSYVETIPPNLGLLADYIAGNWRELIRDAVVSVGTVFHNLGTNLGELAFSIFQFFKDPTGGFVFNWTPLLDGFKATAAAFPELIKPEPRFACRMRLPRRAPGSPTARRPLASRRWRPSRPPPSHRPSPTRRSPRPWNTRRPRRWKSAAARPGVPWPSSSIRAAGMTPNRRRTTPGSWSSSPRARSRRSRKTRIGPKHKPRDLEPSHSDGNSRCR